MAAITYSETQAKPSAGTRKGRKPRRLSAKQLAHPFLAAASNALALIVYKRDQLLPNLRYKANSGRKTRLEVYKALELSSQALLARYDIATGMIGWLDNKGNFRLNTQKGIAKDANLSESAFNRLINILCECKYAQKTTKKVSGKDMTLGVRYVRTESCVRLTALFFRHLNISTYYVRAKKSAVARRGRLLSDIAIHEAQVTSIKIAEQEAIRKRKRTWQSRLAWEAEQASRPVHLRARSLEEAKQRSELALKMKNANPAMTSAEIYALIDGQLKA